ncbi:MAG TPA: hypothetical protein VFN31_03695 [Candidatus Saccharimonadales bacterium]|nr:hypothetical protein [Candidatus Saccharimonadales bacterium]
MSHESTNSSGENERSELLQAIGNIVNSEKASEVIRATWHGEYSDMHVWVESSKHFGVPIAKHPAFKTNTATMHFWLPDHPNASLTAVYNDVTDPVLTAKTTEGEKLTDLSLSTSAYVAYMGNALITALLAKEGNPGLFELPIFNAAIQAAYKSVGDSFGAEARFHNDPLIRRPAETIEHYRTSNRRFPARIFKDILGNGCGTVTSEKLYYMADGQELVEFRNFMMTNLNDDRFPEITRVASVKVSRYLRAPKGNGFRAIELFSRLLIEDNELPTIEIGVTDVPTLDETASELKRPMSEHQQYKSIQPFRLKLEKARLQLAREHITTDQYLDD